MTSKETLQMSKTTSILGFGNPVRRDDGIGIYVANKLQEQFKSQSHITVFDMGTSAFELLFKLRGTERILIVDAVKAESTEEVGSLYKVPAKELQTVPKEDPLVFLHSLKWDQALSYAQKILGADFPEDVQVFLIAVQDIRLDVGLSPEVQAAGDRLVDMLTEELWKG